MSEGRVERRLAAILAADVVGYSRLMGQDEAGTLARMRALRRDLIGPLVADHKGRIVKTTGDGILIEFPSVVEAVGCAVGLQREIAQQNAPVSRDRRIEFRIGINLGDVIVEDGDIHGDGVNVAARLEALAEPGGICVSAAVNDQVRGRLDCNFEDLGDQNLKNIARPVRVYRINTVSRIPIGSVLSASDLSSPAKPSIAVLPFRSIPSEASPNLVGEGLLEDLIETLSRVPTLFVISRLSALAFRSHDHPPQRVGEALGVQYVLSGSIRVAAERVRLTVELTDARSGSAFWTSRIDETLSDLLSVQERLAFRIVRSVGLHVHAAELKRFRARNWENLGEYGYFLRAQEYMHNSSREIFELSEALFDEALAQNPMFAAALAWRAHWHVLRVGQGWSPDPEQDTLKAEEFVRRAIECDPGDAMAFAVSGHVASYLRKDFEAARRHFETALDLNPNSSHAWLWSAVAHAWTGDGARAVKEIELAMALSPYDPLNYTFKGNAGVAYLVDEQYDKSIEYFLGSLRDNKTYTSSYRGLIVAYVFAGRQAEAEETLRLLLKLEPDLTVDRFRKRYPGSASPHGNLCCEALAQAGVPLI